MVLKSIRRQKNRAALEFHLYKITEIGRIRGEWDKEGRKGKVLAANFEMASHASRALSAVRHLEELGEVLTNREAEDFRKSLAHVLNLPAISEADLRHSSTRTIEAAYEEYRRYDFPEEVPVEKPTEPGGLEVPSETQAPDEVVDSALTAWVQAAGRNFSSEDLLDDAIMQIHGRWILLRNAAERGRPIEVASVDDLGPLYDLHCGAQERPDFQNHKRGWIAAMQVVDQLAVAESRSRDAESYEMLLARAKKDPHSVDYTFLRRAYASRDGFNPYALSLEALSQAEDALERGDARQAFELLAPLMETDYLNPKVHQLAGNALEILGRELGRETAADWHKAFSEGLGGSILDSGSGSTADAAFVVISLSEEYWALGRLGASPLGRPRLVEQDGHKYDVFDVVTAQGERQLWFQVDLIRGRLEGMVSARVDASTPEYGGVLLAMAQQCAARGDKRTADILTDRFIEHIRSLEGKELDSEAVARFVALAEETKRSVQ